LSWEAVDGQFAAPSRRQNLLELDLQPSSERRWSVPIVSPAPTHQSRQRSGGLGRLDGAREHCQALRTVFERFAFPIKLRFSDKPSGLEFPQCCRNVRSRSFPTTVSGTVFATG
jgi:hypothetical protein